MDVDLDASGFYHPVLLAYDNKGLRNHRDHYALDNFSKNDDACHRHSCDVCIHPGGYVENSKVFDVFHY